MRYRIDFYVVQNPLVILLLLYIDVLFYHIIKNRLCNIILLFLFFVSNLSIILYVFFLCTKYKPIIVFIIICFSHHFFLSKLVDMRIYYNNTF